MKTKIFKYILPFLVFIFFIACSTKKNNFLSRNTHALSTRDNILYNGQIALDKGVEAIQNGKKDNFWKLLPVERMQFQEESAENGNTKNTDFEKAEEKATKAIQKHSMNIDGQERNYQIDEAYMLLGKARYYDQRFFPALDAFNYILYKYPTSSNISLAKIWREKTNMRINNNAQVLKNITKLLKEKKLKPQIIADANALLAETYLNLEKKDSAIVKLKIAEENTKINIEKTRYRFILGQLYQELGVKDTANFYYQEVINMNRKVDREYVIQAHAKKAQLFDFENGDKNAFIEKYQKLLDSRENKPFLGFLKYEIGVFYEKFNEPELAEKFYKQSLKSETTDNYLFASNYRNIGNMYFKKTNYITAAKYYDSTLVRLNEKTKEYIRIKKVRKDLDEVIEYETTAKNNDSILNVLAMNESGRIAYYEEYIKKLKKSDEEKRILAEKEIELQKNREINNMSGSADPDMETFTGGQSPIVKPLGPLTSPGIQTNNGSNVFYFYNPSTVAFGKLDFKKKFGNRSSEGNWRITQSKTDTNSDNSDEEVIETKEDEVFVAEKPQYSPDFYIGMLPKEQTEIDKIAKDRNFAYYQLGVIYKEKMKEYDLAAYKLERLLTLNPDEKLILPSLYNLYKIYQITNPAKANDLKERISSQYPDSRYAQIINNKSPNTDTESETLEKEYNKWYQLYQEEQFKLILEKIDGLIVRYYGEEIVSKYELLKANTVGKLRGLTEYKKALQFVADNYASSEEGKSASQIISSQIPMLEALTFTKATTDLKNWKVLFKVVNKEDKSTKNLEEKILKLIKDENLSTMSYAFDFYTENENFLTLQGIKTEGFAYYVASLLNDNKKYKVTESAIVIASENYKVVQIKKNFEEYLTFKRNSDIPVPAVEQVPTQKNSNVDSKAIEKTETLPASNTKKNEAQKSLKESNPK